MDEWMEEWQRQMKEDDDDQTEMEVAVTGGRKTSISLHQSEGERQKGYVLETEKCETEIQRLICESRDSHQMEKHFWRESV
ncbi:hypothetical protein PAMP_016232 [Pampus punctatissimus]